MTRAAVTRSGMQQDYRELPVAGVAAVAELFTTENASRRLPRRRREASKYGAPGKCNRAPGAIAAENACVRSSGPATPVSARSELMAPCNFPCAVGSTLCDIKDCIAGPAT